METASPARVRLELIQIREPCPADWGAMRPVEGESSGRVRHCGECDLDVYNISSMTRREAEAFVASRAGFGRTCIRMYQRGDGTVVTADCSKVRAAALAAANRVRWAAITAATLVAGSLAFVDGWFVNSASGVSGGSVAPGSRPLLVEWVDRASGWLVAQLTPSSPSPSPAWQGSPAPMGELAVAGAMAMPRDWETTCFPAPTPGVNVEAATPVVSQAP